MIVKHCGGFLGINLPEEKSWQQNCIGRRTDYLRLAKEMKKFFLIRNTNPDLYYIKVFLYYRLGDFWQKANIAFLLTLLPLFKEQIKQIQSKTSRYKSVYFWVLMSVQKFGSPWWDFFWLFWFCGRIVKEVLEPPKETC